MSKHHRRTGDERMEDGLRMLVAIERYRLSKGIGISFGELRQTLDYASKDKVKRDLEWLVERGWATQVPRTARSVRVSDAGLRALQRRFPDRLPTEVTVATPAVVAAGEHRAPATVQLVPVVPRAIAAGPPLEYFESFDHHDVESWLPLPDGQLRAPERCFAVAVRGESMRDAHILDGDLVVLRQADTATPGQIVGVLLPDEGVTLKRYQPEPAAMRIRFKAENPDVEDILVQLASADDDFAGEAPRIIGTFETLHRGFGQLAG